MRCAFCTKSVTKYQMPDRVEVWNWRGALRVYGNVPMADGRLDEAQGVLQLIYHSKCWLADRRHARVRRR